MKNVAEIEVAYYRKHPEYLRAMADKKVIGRRIMVIVSVTGLALVLLSKVAEYVLVDAPAQGWVELLVELLFETGVALWGAVVTAILLQGYVEHRYEQGRAYQHEIMRRINEEKEDASSGNV